MSSARDAFTIIELITATAIAGIVGGVIAVTLMRQQRFYSAATEMLGVRAQLRDAADVLASDIRSAAVAAYGLPLMTDSAIELVTAIGSSVLCDTPFGATVKLPPAKLANGGSLTSFQVPPDDGDIAVLYGSPLIVADTARWQTIAVASFAARSLESTCPPATGFTTASDVASGNPGYALTLVSPPSSAVRKGAPIRVLRRVRYSLYRSSDARWYLGYKRCRLTAPYTCASVQPVSGPYEGYAANGSGGVAFRYYDAQGAELATTGRGFDVARVDIVVRGTGNRATSLAGDLRKTFRDSVRVAVSPRNRNR